MTVELPVVTPKAWNIFKSTHSGTFNACIGENSLHDLRTYADGYIEASVLLLDTILAKRLIGQMDTLVHPILYSARHAIELTIKSVLFELNNCDLKTEETLITGHSLSKLWACFDVVAQKDSRLNELYLAINPILKTLDAADPDAQDFRYPTGNAQKGVAPIQTLQGKAIVDLLTVSDMIKKLQGLLKSLHGIAETVSYERRLGTYTQELNRDELKALAIECGYDSSRYFEETKAKWMKTRRLSNRAFRRATEFIKAHREFAGYSGTETDLIAIPSELLDKIIVFKMHELLQKQHQTQERKHNYIVTFEEIEEDITKEPISFEAYRSLKDSLTLEVVAELHVLYYLSYTSDYSENYQSNYDLTLKGLNNCDEITKANECMESFLHVFEKTNFLENLINSLTLVGQNTKSKSYLDKLESLKVLSVK